VAGDFSRPDGITFSEDDGIAYMKKLKFTELIPPPCKCLPTRRVFVRVDTSVPEVIQVDKAGNVYSGCGDGV
jgi:gluconolactonase